MKPAFFKILINFYPPYMWTGISLKDISPDYKKIIIQMKMRFYNRNYVKTHFGGSLYAMTDPIYMVMLINILGRGHIVWDKTARIEFIKPGTGTVTAEFIIDDNQINEIYRNTSSGKKYLPEYTVDIIDEAGEIVAKVFKTLYIRKKD